MDCPYCEEEMTYEDYYGPFVKEHYWTPAYIKRVGDIYRCNNEDCEYCGENFYTDAQEELHDGYPC